MKKPGYEVGVDVSAFLLLAAFYIANMLDVYAIALLCAAIHELGHLAAIYLCGGRLQGIYFKPFGVHICTQGTALCSYYKDLLIYSAGPAANLAAGCIAYYAMAGGRGLGYLSYFCGVNLVLFTINLIPVAMLDGGKIIRSLLLLYCDYEQGEILSQFISIFSTMFLLVCGILVFMVTRYNISLLAVALYLTVVMVAQCMGKEKHLATGDGIG